MKIAVVDPVNWDYTPLTPLERPLGGSQSAICYLTRELAALGHETALVNNVGSPGVYAGVHCPGRAAAGTAEYLNRFDAVVGVNSAMGLAMRELGIRAPLVLWSQQAADQKDIQRLRDANERSAWDRFFLVSDWQARTYVSSFGIEPARVTILRNAAAPIFLNLERRTPPFFRSGAPPVLVYTSTPYRGLLILLLAFPTIRAAIPGCRLRVFSSMGVYQIANEQDIHYRVLYALARALPDVEYSGSISQSALADAVAESDILAYPNIFPETSCIAVMEAMAAGCLVATTTLGALPETTAGFGILMESRPDLVIMAREYADLVLRTVRSARESPDKFEDHLSRQRAHARTAHSWTARAREWVAAVESLARQR
jgi:glycosyltransferase involved in cell wall biosynthesis